jgi:hypothetical protein
MGGYIAVRATPRRGVTFPAGQLLCHYLWVAGFDDPIELEITAAGRPHH